MPHFVMIGRDKAGALEIRKATREAHLAYLAAHAGTVLHAGPVTDADDNPCGSVLIIEANDRASVEALIAADPYAAAGVFQSVEILPWKWVIGR